MKHTKGKWITDDSSTHLTQDIKIIAQSPELECVVAYVPNYKFIDSKPNAKLISKAPEMYEALKDFEANCDLIHNHIRLGDNIQAKLDNCLDVINKLKTAINPLLKELS